MNQDIDTIGNYTSFLRTDGPVFIDISGAEQYTLAVSSKVVIERSGNIFLFDLDTTGFHDSDFVSNVCWKML